jgi:2-keto-4-pentenoate hydratase/2-oxohepta-3-ene-1,7-dioic acid hydratase in catechol pathway
MGVNKDVNRDRDGPFIKPGDVVEISIAGIGTLRTPIKAMSQRPE